MTTDLTDIDGVGPSYADDLDDAGYESAEDVADADPEDVDDVLPTTSGEDLVAVAKSEVQTEDDEDVEVEENESDDDTGADDDPAKEEYFELDTDFSEDQEHHLIAALVNEEVKSRRRNNRDRLDASREAIETVRDGQPYEFTLQQLSIAYTATNQLESEYRGTRGLASFVSEVRELTQFFQQARQENWPADDE